MKKGFLICIVLSVLLPFTTFAHSYHKVLVLSDIHLNPFSTCHQTPCKLISSLQKAPITKWAAIFSHTTQKKFPSYGQDTNYYLLDSMMKHLSSLRTHYNMVLVLGDYLSHNFKKHYFEYSNLKTQKAYSLFVDKTLTFVIYEIHKGLSDEAIFGILGNNDSYLGDYGSTTSGKLYRNMEKKLKDKWFTHLFSAINTKLFMKTFTQYGYFELKVPTEHNNYLLFLNTIVYSVSSKNTKYTQKIRKQQLIWLVNRLKKARLKHQKIWILGHISIGGMPYLTIKNKKPEMMLLARYNAALLKIYRQYPDVIRFILNGHMHRDGYLLIKTKKETILNSITPSLSPSYYNNPGYKVYYYDPKSFTAFNFDTYYLNLTANKPFWKLEYNFNKTYQPKCKHCSMLNVYEKLSLNNPLNRLYKKFYTMSYYNAEIYKHWPVYWCWSHYPSVKGYGQCLKTYGLQSHPKKS